MRRRKKHYPRTNYDAPSGAGLDPTESYFWWLKVVVIPPEVGVCRSPSEEKKMGKRKSQRLG
jgi:hypothetical protein